MITFKEFLKLSEGMIEHDHIKQVMDKIAPEKRAFARKTYHTARGKGMPHAAALSAMRVHVEDIDLSEFDSLVESVKSNNDELIAHRQSRKELAMKRMAELDAENDKLTPEEKVAQNAKAEKLLAGVFKNKDVYKKAFGS